MAMRIRMLLAFPAATVRYLRLPRADRARILEALRELLRAFLLVRSLGWIRYAKTLGEAVAGEPMMTWDGDRSEARAVGRAVDRWRRVAPRSTTCLIRSIAGQRMLTRRSIPSALVLGLRVDRDQKALAAHGWLRVGSEVVIGREDMIGHVAVASFTSLSTGG
jgi:hypothetical protein